MVSLLGWKQFIHQRSDWTLNGLWQGWPPPRGHTWLQGSYPSEVQIFLQTKSTYDLWEWSNSSSFMSAKLSWRFLSFPHRNLKMGNSVHGSCIHWFEVSQGQPLVFLRVFNIDASEVTVHAWFITYKIILKFVCFNGERLTEYIKSIPMYNSAVPRNRYNKWSHLYIFFYMDRRAMTTTDLGVIFLDT